MDELNKIYLSLAVDEDNDFDVNEYLAFVENTIDSSLSDTVKLMSSDELLSNVMLVNQTLVDIIKTCKKKPCFNPGLIFVQFCSYFDIDERKTYLMLHEKVQNLIKGSAIKQSIDKEVYLKYKRESVKNQGYFVPNMFEMFNR